MDSVILAQNYEVARTSSDEGTPSATRQLMSDHSVQPPTDSKIKCNKTDAGETHSNY